eukprot:2841600-Prymnesium_polylepis.1
MLTGSPPATGSAAIRTASEEQDEVGEAEKRRGHGDGRSPCPRQLAALAAGSGSQKMQEPDVFFACGAPKLGSVGVPTPLRPTLARLRR